MIEKNFLLVSNENYLEHGEILLKSLFLNTSRFKVHYFLITNKRKIKLNKIFYNKNIFLYFKKKKGNNYKEIKAYYANSRIEFCKELFFKKNIEHLMYMDVDSLVMRDITKIYISFLSKNKILQIKKRKTKYLKNKFMTGIFLLKKNRDFINCWIRNLKNKKFEWFGDQLSIYKVSQNKKFKKLIINLPFEYIDFNLGEKAYIWSGRSGTKNYYKYKLEKFLIKLFYLKPDIKKKVDNSFLKKILSKILDFYDQKFTRKFFFLFKQN